MYKSSVCNHIGALSTQKPACILFACIPTLELANSKQTAVMHPHKHAILQTSLTSLAQSPQEKGANVVLNMLQELLSCNDTSFLTDDKLFWVAINSLLH